jgi:stage III sporulation protein AH
LTVMAANEGMLESMIIAQGYEDALVTTNGNNATIIVKAANHSKKDAAEIMLLGLDQLGHDMTVMVEFIDNN